ncbi:MAG: hypothetical protein RR413_09995 [Christensenellaceae bacterium]
MERDMLLHELAGIIKNYRTSEFSITIDEQHVLTWIKQFSLDAQDTILSEITNIMKKWYFDRNKIISFLSEVCAYMQKRLKYESVADLIANVSFVLGNETGQSQKLLFSELQGYVNTQNSIILNNNITTDITHYIYVDDGVYSGQHVKKELPEILIQLPKGSTLDAFFIVASTTGLMYVEKMISALAEQRSISFSINSFKRISNDRFVKYDNNSSTYSSSQECLWPSVTDDKEITKYLGELRKASEKCEKKPFRKNPWDLDCGIFSSLYGRNVVEYEFLKKGIHIIQTASVNKGIYPLGYNPWPSFGFGSICSFDYNISNTCPVVLWWGNIEKQGNILDAWYPLLPRRVNDKSCLDTEDFDMDGCDYLDTFDQNNVCPDCGRRFGIDSDGGNGFCINCAWKH